MILLTSICIVFVFGVGAGFGLSFVLGVNSPGTEISKVVVLGNIDVSDAEKALDKDIDTEQGKLYVNYEIPDKLPLCIKEDYVDKNFKLTVTSYGGYVPDLDELQILNIIQKKTGKAGALSISWDDGVELCGECPGIKYTASFDIIGGSPIQLDSNHLPKVYTSGVDWAWLVDGCPSPNLDKWVTIDVVSSWEGCHKPDQKFQLIVAHKRCFQSLTPNENLVAS